MYIYVLVIQRFRVVYHGISHTSQSEIWAGIRYATHDGKVVLNTEYKTAFLNSDWLCFLWRGINHHSS